jgi:hypothetical protein
MFIENAGSKNLHLKIVCAWSGKEIKNVLWVNPERQLAEIAITDINGCIIVQNGEILTAIIRGDFNVTK